MLLTATIDRHVFNRSSRLILCLTLIGAVFPAWAQRESTQESLQRLEETMEIRLEDGTGVLKKEVLPLLVVSLKPAFEETRTWFPTQALATLARLFGNQALRSCEACMQPRFFSQDGRMEQNLGDPSPDEMLRLDESIRGTASPARSAVWLDETPEGVSFKVVDLRNGRILWAENFDANYSAKKRTQTNLKLTRELDRRIRGDALVHSTIDFGVLPHQHISLEWTEQWGDTNHNLAGFVLSLFDPVLGVGACYYRIIPQAFNLTVGVQGLLSLPNALVTVIGRNNNQQLFDALFTGALVVRFPISTSNFAIFGSVSTNGRVAFGLSLLNFSLLPFLP